MRMRHVGLLLGTATVLVSAAVPAGAAKTANYSGVAILQEAGLDARGNEVFDGTTVGDPAGFGSMQVVLGPGDCMPDCVGSGTWSLRLQDGASITGTLGYSQLYLCQSPCSEYDLHAILTVTGGTKRYTNATGNGRFDGDGDGWPTRRMFGQLHLTLTH